MSKYALLKYSNGNLGDEIQSIAARDFLPSLDHYIDRDYFNEFKNEDKTKILVHGWFTHNPENWPPVNNNIDPLFISFHISDSWGSSAEKMTNSASIKYYKEHEPIGCRDYNTLRLLEAKGVDSYFSGCITLTLKNRFKSRTNKIYFVDVDKKARSLIPEKEKDNVIFLSHVGRLYQTHRREWFRSLLRSRHLRNRYVQYRFNKAQEVIDLYAQAKLVVTSRLHCALPCLAFGTPLIFILKDPHDPRLEGLKELMNFCSREDASRGKVEIDWDDPEPNPVDITPIRNRLIKTCERFIEQK